MNYAAGIYSHPRIRLTARLSMYTPKFLKNSVRAWKARSPSEPRLTHGKGIFVIPNKRAGEPLTMAQYYVFLTDIFFNLVAVLAADSSHYSSGRNHKRNLTCQTDEGKILVFLNTLPDRRILAP